MKAHTHTKHLVPRSLFAGPSLSEHPYFPVAPVRSRSSHYFRVRRRHCRQHHPLRRILHPKRARRTCIDTPPRAVIGFWNIASRLNEPKNSACAQNDQSKSIPTAFPYRRLALVSGSLSLLFGVEGIPFEVSGIAGLLLCMCIPARFRVGVFSRQPD